MATNNVFKSSTIYGVLRNSDNTTASPNVLANAIFDRDVNVTGKVVTDRINSKTGRIDMSGNIIDISGNTIYLGHTGSNVYIKDVLYGGGDVTLAGNNNFTGTNTFNAASTIKNSLNFTNGSNPLTAKIEPVDMGGSSVIKITSKGLLYIDCNNIVPDPDPYIPYFYYQGFYYGNPTTTQPYTIESNGGLTLNAPKLKLQSSGDINLATASVTRYSTPTLTDNSLELATTAFVKGQNYITSSALTPYAPLASPALTGTPTAPTALTADNSTTIATTAFVKAQNYLTTATASSTYQTISGMSSYLTTATAASTYATISSLSSYLTTATASSTYQTISGMSSYLTTATAGSTYAPLASPALTGTPTAPTAVTSTNTTQIATTAFVKAQNYLTSASLSAYALLASPTFTGTPAAPTALTADNSTTIATTAFVKAQNYLTSAALSGYALLASPTFTGTPAAPTALTADNSTTIATTAFVKAQNYLTSATASSTYQTISGMSSYLTTATAGSTYAPLASPALTGTPTAPTAAVGTNTTQLATTAFVLANGGGSVTLGGTNAWTGTNSFNTNLPTSTATPSSSTQLITKNYGDSTYVSLTANNTGFTGDLRGVSMYRAGYNTIAIGYDNLPASSTSNYDNFAFGTGVMKYMTSGNNNVGVGNYVFGLATTSNESVAVGIQALGQVLTGGQNTAVGFCASQNTTGSSNTSIGNLAGLTLTSGTRNTYIGSESGGGLITTGSYNTAIGDNSGKHNYSNTTCIGYNSVATANNQIVLGTTSETTISKGGIDILESKNLNFRQNSSGNTSTIQFLNNAGAALALIYGSTSSNALNFDAYSSSLTNGFRFLFGGTQVAKISPTGQLSAGQPKYWFLSSGSGGNAYTPAGRNIGGSFNVGGYYWNSISAYGGASTSSWATYDGVFTAPENGTYSFFLSIFNNGTATTGRWMAYGGSCVLGGFSYANFNQSYTSGEGSITTHVIYYMTAGQTFYWYAGNQSPNLFYANGHTCGIITKIY